MVRLFLHQTVPLAISSTTVALCTLHNLRSLIRCMMLALYLSAFLAFIIMINQEDEAIISANI